EVIKLCEAGAVTDINEAGKDSGKTALHWAAQKGHFGILCYLIVEKGAQIDSLDKDGNTPLNLLVQSTQCTLATKQNIIIVLLCKGADPILPNKAGRTAFNNI